MNLQGYKTVIVFGIAAVAGIFGHHLSPEVLQQYSTDVIALIGVAGVALRLVTNTPFGQKEISALEARGVVSEDVVQQVLARLPKENLTALLIQVEQLKQDLAAKSSTSTTTPTASLTLSAGQTKFGPLTGEQINAL